MRHFTRTTVLILGMLTVLGIVFFQFLISDLNPSFDKTGTAELPTAVAKAKSLPQEFIDVYNDVNPIKSTSGILYDWIRLKYGSVCPCLVVASMNHHLIREENRITGNRYWLSWKLERKVSQEDCLRYLVRHFNFLYGKNDIFKASEYYFNKEFANLETEEFATLVLMLKNSSLYNPKRRPELIMKRLKNL